MLRRKKIVILSKSENEDTQNLSFAKHTKKVNSRTARINKISDEKEQMLIKLLKKRWTKISKMSGEYVRVLTQLKEFIQL